MSGAIQSIAAAIIFAAGSGLGAAPEALAQETCYQDDDGRIVTRRRPGYREVPCPAAATPQTGDEAAAAEQTDAQRRADLTIGTREVTGRPERTRNAASPVPRPGLNDYVSAVPVPDRWRIVDTLGYEENLWDPYNRNILKADRPVKEDKFFNITVISDSVYEVREVPTPIGSSSTNAPGGIDVFGSADQYVLVENLRLTFPIPAFAILQETCSLFPHPSRRETSGRSGFVRIPARNAYQ
jgi:hypothetical protein